MTGGEREERRKGRGHHRPEGSKGSRGAPTPALEVNGFDRGYELSGNWEGVDPPQPHRRGVDDITEDLPFKDSEESSDGFSRGRMSRAMAGPLFVLGNDWQSPERDCREIQAIAPTQLPSVRTHKVRHMSTTAHLNDAEATPTLLR